MHCALTNGEIVTMLNDYWNLKKKKNATYMIVIRRKKKGGAEIEELMLNPSLTELSVAI